jgi:hypothetical protein
MKNLTNALDFLMCNPKELVHPIDQNFKFRWLYCFYVQDGTKKKLKIGHSCNPVKRNKQQGTQSDDALYFALGFMEIQEARKVEQEVFQQIEEFVVREPILGMSKTPTHKVDLDFKHSYAFSGATETFIIRHEIDFSKILYVLQEVTLQSYLKNAGSLEDLSNLIAHTNSIPTEKIKNIYDI